ncbi:palmitoyltransferase, partial [Haematococcus lacustris]
MGPYWLHLSAGPSDSSPAAGPSGSSPAAEDPSGSSPAAEDPSDSSSSNKRKAADIGSGLADERAFQFDPATQMGMGLDPGAIQAVSAASGVWDEDGCLDSFIRSKLTRSQKAMQLEEEAAVKSQKRWGTRKQLVVFFGNADIGTRGRQQQQLMRDQRRRTCFARFMRCLASMQWLVVALVFLLTCSIILLGVAYILPITCHGAPVLFAASHVATATLTFLILFNYAAIKIGEAVPPLAFDNHRFCYECQTFKPPDAHHCSTCRTCVVDLDHHCPFVNNCVGRANMRNFLHFMAATLAAMLFCLAHCLHLIRLYGGKLRQLLGRGKAGLGPGGWDLLTGLGEFLVGCPAPLAAALYISVAGGLVLVSVGSLFWSTLPL